ncbi:MAG TPA: carboxypeptidase-like regulatory domain-containing protein [Bryobacteraceae bacterium]
MLKLANWAGGLILALVLVSCAWSQGLFGTLTGVVTDPSGAVIANAKVTLANAESGSQRQTTTNSDGYYTFASVPVGTYNLTINAHGFQTYHLAGAGIGGTEKVNINASLQLGATSQTIEVSGAPELVTPVDSGALTNTLTAHQLQNYVQVGSNAAGFIKIMPGFGISNGTQNKANYDGQTIGINANGDAGSQSPLNNAFSYNGLPGNTLDIVIDGAHVSDPGCNCDTPVNPNSNFIQEFRVLSSNYGADAQKGPMVITAVSKSGGEHFHGEAFFDARNYTLNSNDAYFNATGAKQAQNEYYYPGGDIGGPVLLPFTHFNRNRNKLFFFTGYEYFYQVLDTGLLTATVPTAGELNGDFSPAEVAKEGLKTASGGPPGQVDTSLFPGGQIPAASIDPNMVALMKLYPGANADPNATGGFNYVKSEIFNQNNFQWESRVDVNISDNTKLFVRYNMQRETQQFPVGLWWRQTDQVPYPTAVQGKNRSDSVTASLTHVFSPTMTNEVVLAYTFVGFPNVFEDPSKVDRKTVGYNDPTLFGAGVSQIPSFGGSGGAGEAALVFMPGGFEAGGPSAGLYANKYMPSFSDDLTKVWGTHTVKLGFFYEWIRNAQPANEDTNGYLQFVPTNNASFTYGNAYADEITGNASQYTEANFNRINEISYNTIEGYLEDSWKVTPRLTLHYGLRITHFTPWSDDEGFGYSIFLPKEYGPGCTQSPTFCGFEWHSRNHSVPLGGFPTATAYLQPRFGLAYDLTGKGDTVLRGGWGRFYYHSGQFTSGLETAAGEAVVTVSPSNLSPAGNLFASQLDSVPFTAQLAAPGAVDSNDDHQPYTDSYSFTISQRVTHSALLDIGYVGNQSHDIQNSGGAGSNQNLVPVGAMLGQPNPATANANNFRPYVGYGDINLATNNLYANYNALQAKFLYQHTHSTVSLNYTFGKALGIVGGGTTLGATSATLDPFNLRNNYGIQPGNRTHIFHAAYSFDMGNPIHSNKFVDGVLNGWQISGIVNWESGANLTYNSGYNFNMQTGSAILPDSVSAANPKGIAISNQSILGTNAIQLNPILTCNPTANLKPQQFINSDCFTLPTTVGVNGPTLLPVAYGPGFFDADLGLFKNFRISESKKLQLRIQAYNFLNHPNWSFPSGTNNLTLDFAQDPTTGAITQTNPNFGYTTAKQGNRIVELEAKFYF